MTHKNPRECGKHSGGVTDWIGVDMSERTCSKCGEVKPATPEFFHKQRECKDGLRPSCRECHKKQSRAYYLANSAERRAKVAEYAAANAVEVAAYRVRYRASRREALAAMDRASTLMREYGLTPDQYMNLFERQGGRCAICKAGPKTKRLSVDHDHETGAIRGLLCTPCNTALGRFGDTEAGLLNALRYLQQSPNLAVAPSSPIDAAESGQPC